MGLLITSCQKIIELLVQVKTSRPEFGIVKEEFLEWFEQDVPLVINVQNQLYIRLNHERDEKTSSLQYQQRRLF